MSRSRKPSLASILTSRSPAEFAPADTPSEPFEGVPAHLQTSLFDWLAPIVMVQYGDGYGRGVGLQYRDDRSGFMKLAERRLRITLDWRNRENSAAGDIQRKMMNDDDLFLRVLGLAIENVSMGYAPNQCHDKIDELNAMLHEGGSVWEVSGNGWGQASDPWHLRRRTTTAAAASVADVVGGGGEVAEHMSAAWREAFGQHPNETEAYSRAVKAVEAAAIPVVLPSQPLATLGTVIRELRDHAADWQVVWTRESATQDVIGRNMQPIEVVMAMMSTLWANQTDRHGAGQSVPVTPSQAEAAVHLALTLVQLFRSGAISRV